MRTQRLSASVPAGRRTFYVIAALLLIFLGLAPWFTWALWLALPLALLFALGLYDLSQRRRTVSRNYPIVGHIRYLLESIGPEIRQYFIEADTDERPYSREQRALIYQRAKAVLDKRPFGTLHDVYGEGYEWINHSMVPLPSPPGNFRIPIGNNLEKPYHASVLNISAMSFGSLSPNAIRALNKGAARGGFYHDTGEGSISRYHREFGGDLVWEIGSGYFGCRDLEGRFSEERFVENARSDQVKMIEIKLSQGAKPGMGGVLPGPKVSPEIAEARGVPVGKDVVSPARHSAFATPLELMLFMQRLRELSGGKPVGFKLAIGHPWEWFSLVKAMLETGLPPDFIVVDGAEGGTGAAPLEFMNRVGVPLRDGLLLVHNALVGTELRPHVRIGAAGKITSAFTLARTLALGADWCNAARAFMFSLGCIQATSCHNDRCPSGVATQDPHRWKNLDVEDKAGRVFHFHQNTVKALAELLGASGLQHPDDLGPEHIIRRISAAEVKSYAALFPYLEPGALLHGSSEHAVFQRFWGSARADRFNLTGA